LRRPSIWIIWIAFAASFRLSTMFACYPDRRFSVRGNPDVLSGLPRRVPPGFHTMRGV
jgi:hypothetical protein